MQIADMKSEIREHEPLSSHTSFGIGGPADYFACPADQEDLKALFRFIRERNLHYFILGNGTNLLVRDGGFRGMVISLQHMNAVTVEHEYRSIGGNFSVLSAEAGAPLSKLLALAVEKGLTGIEFAAGIPGTVGGAVRMNAGTALGEMGDIVDTVTMISPEGGLIKRVREEMGFAYRTASVPEGHMVLEARVILRRDQKEKVSSRIQELLEERKQRQPWSFPNAGSIFKNPHEKSAGKLIESAGLKGRTIGGAQISDVHANFIVTTGPARAADVLALMNIVKQAVLDVHGVRLEPEIKVIGED
jgi:UDP-N-acetylmuramate dehydrogenase